MRRSHSTSGTALVAAVFTVAILASISAGVLMNVTTKHQNSYQAAAWREALVSAESGLERTIAELNSSIAEPQKAWTGWTVVNQAGTPAADQKIDRDGRWAAGYTLLLDETLPPQSGERAQPRYSVMVDVPSTLAASNRRWNQSYRIRSTGLAALPGTARAPSDKRDSQLRRLSLIWDRTSASGTRLAAPQATRTIEIIAKPESVYGYGLTAEMVFKLSRKTFVDGYNSNYEDTSTNGRYDPAKRTPDGGTILANRWRKKPKPAQAVEKFDVGHATVYGDLLVRGTLKNVKNYERVQGNKVTNVSRETPTNLEPVWTSVTDNIAMLDGKVPKDVMGVYKLAEKQAKDGGPAAQFDAKAATAAAVLAAKGVELTGGLSPSDPSRFKVEKIQIDKKDESIIISNPPGASESWVEIWVTEEMKINHGGTVFLSNGVHATIYLQGKAEIKDTKNDNGGFIVESGFAGDLQLIGIEKSDAKKETDDEYSPRKRSGKINISDADFTGAIFAPDWDVDFKPKDWDKDDTIYGGQLFGTVVGRKVKIGNGADYHYDEAIAEMGSVRGYSIAGWNEVER